MHPKKWARPNRYLIGPDEWMEGRRIGRVIPNPTPPVGSQQWALD